MQALQELERNEDSICTFVLVKQILLYHRLKLELVQALQELERKKDQTPCPEMPQQGFKGERD